MAMMGVLTLSAQNSVYDFTVKDDAGKDVSLAESIQEIHQFCTANFDIHFPQFDKIDVNGENAHPLYTYLKAQAGGGDIKWNCTKFLIGRDGKVIKRYESRDQVATIEADMQMEVNAR